MPAMRNSILITYLRLSFLSYRRIIIIIKNSLLVHIHCNRTQARNHFAIVWCPRMIVLGCPAQSLFAIFGELVGGTEGVF